MARKKKVKPVPISPETEGWAELIQALKGPAALNFHTDKSGNRAWYCSGTFLQVELCLRGMGVPEDVIGATLERLPLVGYKCSCDVVLGSETRLDGKEEESSKGTG